MHSSRMHTARLSGCLSCMHTPTTHAPHNTCPPVMHDPHHTCPNPPCHACFLATHAHAMHTLPLPCMAPSWTESQTGVKHYLPATSFAGGKNIQVEFWIHFYSWNASNAFFKPMRSLYSTEQLHCEIPWHTHLVQEIKASQKESTDLRGDGFLF